MSITPPVFSQENHEIVVDGKAVPFRFDPKRNVIVLEGEFLRSVPSFNIAQLLSLAGNIQIVPRGLFQADSQMGGFHQEQVVVMINGTPWMNAQTGHHNLSLPFDTDRIERIEILRSGDPSPNAMTGAGGLINIVTSSSSGFRASLSSFNTKSASLGLGSKKAYLSMGGTTTDGWMKGLDGRHLHLQGGIRLDSLEFWGGATSSGFGAQNFYSPSPSYENLDKFMASAVWRKPVFKAALLEVRASSQFSHDVFKLDRENASKYTNNHRTFQSGVSASLRGRNKSLSYVVNATADFDRIDSRGIRSGIETSALGDHARRFFSLAAEADYEKNGVVLQSSLRGTCGSADRWSGKILAGYRFRGDTLLSASIDRTFRLPTYTELYYEDPTHHSNPALRPESVTSASLSLESRQGRFEGGFRIFGTRSDDLIDWRYGETGNVWISENIKRGKSFGADIQGSFLFSGVPVLKILYTWQKAVFRNVQPEEILRYRFYCPRHSLSLLWNGRIFRILTLSAALKWEKEKAGAPGCVMLNLRNSLKFGRIRPYLELLNLFDARMERTPGLLDPPRSLTAGIVFDF